MECSCQSLINPIKELQQARINVLLTWVPHEKKHDPMTIIKKMLVAETNVMQSRALINIVPLIAHMHAWAKGANAGNLCHAQPPAHLCGRLPDRCAQTYDDMFTTWSLWRAQT